MIPSTHLGGDRRRLKAQFLADGTYTNYYDVHSLAEGADVGFQLKNDVKTHALKLVANVPGILDSAAQLVLWRASVVNANDESTLASSRCGGGEARCSGMQQRRQMPQARRSMTTARTTAGPVVQVRHQIDRL